MFGRNCKRFGQQAWVMCVIVATEFLIAVKVRFMTHFKYIQYHRLSNQHYVTTSHILFSFSTGAISSPTRRTWSGCTSGWSFSPASWPGLSTSSSLHSSKSRYNNYCLFYVLLHNVGMRIFKQQRLKSPKTNESTRLNSL